MPRDTTHTSSPPRPTPPTMSDREFATEVWRALIIIMRAFMLRYRFRLPRMFDEQDSDG